MEKELQTIPRDVHTETSSNGVPRMSVSRSHVVTVPVAASNGQRESGGLLEYWQMVRRHQGMVALAGVLGLVIGYLCTLPQKRTYQARTTLEIQGLNEDFLNMKNVNPTLSETSSMDSEVDIQTQARILQSRALLQAVYRKMSAMTPTEHFEVPDRLSAWFKALGIHPPTPVSLRQEALDVAAGSVKVKVSNSTRIVDVSTDSTNPQVAADFANTLAAEYIQQNLEARWKSSEHTGEWLTKQLQGIKIKLEKDDDQLQAYARDAKLTITDEKNNIDEERLSQLQKDLSAAEADRIGKQSKYEMASSSPLESLPDVLDDPTLNGYQKDLTELNRQYAQLRTTFTPVHADVKRVQAQITAVETSLDKERADILRRIRNDYEQADRREKLLAADYSRQAQLVTDQGVKLTHYNILKREVDTGRQLYETMLQMLKQASIASALRASNIRVVDAAEPPTVPYKPNVFRTCFIGLFFGLGAGVGFAVLRERADRTIQDPGDASYYLNLAELGVIPIGNAQSGLKSAKPSGLLAAAAIGNNGHGSAHNGNGHQPKPNLPIDQIELETWSKKRSVLAESFRTTLTSIFFSGINGERPRVLVLTSASPKEGKTTTASNLAISVAEINQRVVLIDADMRRPRLHQIFKIDNTLGLADVLLRNEPLTDDQVDAILRPTGIPGLSLISSGMQRHSASTLVHSDRLPELIGILRRRFDTVVIDTPPMVNISDARMLARHGDALILVVRSAVTTRDAAGLAQKRFVEDGIPIMGVILNGWNPKTPGYHYHRYYYDGYHHYYGRTDRQEA
jgi:polysaccharide biosynthesis transport protein